MEKHRLIDNKLEILHDRILQMGGEAENALARAMRSLVERDSDLAADVLAHDDVIDRLELEIDRAAVEIFALLQPAARVSDRTSFFLLGKLIETNSTSKMFTKPDEKLTEDYITGRFG